MFWCSHFKPIGTINEEMNVFSKKYTYFKLLINNGPKWPDTFQKSCSFCCKIFLSVYFGALKYIKVLKD